MILFTYLSFTLTSLSWSHSLELQCLSQSVCWIQWHLSQFSQWPLFKIRKRFFQMWRKVIAMKSSLIFSLHVCCLTCWVSSISCFLFQKFYLLLTVLSWSTNNSVDKRVPAAMQLIGQPVVTNTTAENAIHFPLQCQTFSKTSSVGAFYKTVWQRYIIAMMTTHDNTTVNVVS